MKIEQFLKKCWSAGSLSVLEPDSIERFLGFFEKCLERRIGGLDAKEKVSMMSTYLHLLGYDNQIISSGDQLSIRYIIPGPIQLDGIAINDEIGDLSFIEHNKNVPYIDFIIFFNLNDNNKLSGNSIPTKMLIVRPNDCVRILLLILAIRLYRNFEHEFKINNIIREWFFEYLRKKWGADQSELNRLESQWNAISKWKIENTMF